MSEDAVRKARDAFIGGAIMGWASQLEDPNEVKSVITHMLEFSKKLATGAGVTMFEKNGSK